MVAYIKDLQNEDVVDVQYIESIPNKTDFLTALSFQFSEETCSLNNFIIVTPQRGPRITGGQSRYQIGDVVRVNCTSYPSKPVCHLSWLINGEPANRSYLKYYDNIVYGREGLEVAILGLEFRVRGYHFKNGDMKLKCVAKISSLYFQSREESVESDRPQRAPALESRETVAANPRAHGSSNTGNLLQISNYQLLIIIYLMLTSSGKFFMYLPR
uniref:CD80-like immunoglobulin C2-set domain-containing protein n=1 Tax=Glossina brevipalpis TaxID=37001 RepID=A0A1A9WUN3_9MUSC